MIRIECKLGAITAARYGSVELPNRCFKGYIPTYVNSTDTAQNMIEMDFCYTPIYIPNRSISRNTCYQELFQ